MKEKKKGSSRARAHERERERERATHEGRFRPLTSFAHTISDHYTCTRIRSQSARRYARVKKRGMLQSGHGTEKSRERELGRRREWKREKEKEILAHARAKRGKLLHAPKSRLRRAAAHHHRLHRASPSREETPGFERTQSERERENGSLSRAATTDSREISSFTEVACIFDIGRDRAASSVAC